MVCPWTEKHWMSRSSLSEILKHSKHASKLKRSLRRSKRWPRTSSSHSNSHRLERKTRFLRWWAAKWMSLKANSSWSGSIWIRPSWRQSRFASTILGRCVVVCPQIMTMSWGRSLMLHLDRWWKDFLRSCKMPNQDSLKLKQLWPLRKVWWRCWPTHAANTLKKQTPRAS